MLKMKTGNPERKLKYLLETVSQSCSRYLTLISTKVVATTMKTRLDRERLKMCRGQVENVASVIRLLRPTINQANVKDKLKIVHNMLMKLKKVRSDPQHSLPDVFIWMVQNKKRIAYHRLTASSLIYSTLDDEKGANCGRLQTLVMKTPQKKGSSYWTTQARLSVYLWLGAVKHRKKVFEGLPSGYQTSNLIRNIAKPDSKPPSIIKYTDSQNYQLRAYMYQARGLIGSDDTGLSDPFARVVFGHESSVTRVIDETLNPSWDEMLIFRDVRIFSSFDDVMKMPPEVVVEIFDRDRVGKSEFIGHSVAYPVVKGYRQKYEPPKFPAKLCWHDVYRGAERAGELLAAFELLQLAPHGESSCDDLPPCDLPIVLDPSRSSSMPVPRGIRPTLSTHRIEVLFWGVRDMKRVQFMAVEKPRVDVECSGKIISSSIIRSCRRNPNFSAPIKYVDVDLPDNDLYCPPITIRCFDCRNFGRFVLVGNHVIDNIRTFIYSPAVKKDPTHETKKLKDSDVKQTSSSSSSSATKTFKKPQQQQQPQQSSSKRKRSSTHSSDDETELEGLDWWTKYHASVLSLATTNATKLTSNNYLEITGCHSFLTPDKTNTAANAATSPTSVSKSTSLKLSKAANLVAKLSPKSQKRKEEKKINWAKLKIYHSDLESEFNGFKEWLHTYDLYRGKKTNDADDDDSRVVGKFKGAIVIYKHPLPNDIEEDGGAPSNSLFQCLPSNEPLHVLVRVYVVKAIDLHPADINGKADPYIVIKLGQTTINDKENYISKQLNPVFGKCFEVEAIFPQDSLLRVQVYDWDLIGADDIIGWETVIDLENRYFSRHRATCGLALQYDAEGYNAWRDPMKPTAILSKLCKDYKLDGPYYQPGRVRISNMVFNVPAVFENEKGYCVKTKSSDESLALTVLHNWEKMPKVGCKLVAEHVEKRALYHPDKPGMEQGKLEMWVDMFPIDMPAPGPPVDISPRKPKSYELRVIIWNTDDVVLEDDAFFTGEKMSDIYVKGWIKGTEDMQSLTGEGNFNWRFIFPFEYLVAEEKVVMSRKDTVFSWDETETKIPARLNLQVWDADHFSADDFLGAMTFELTQFPRGAKSSKQCTLDMLKTDGSVPQINLFKHKRVKGWWPFYVKVSGEEMELTGKVEAELHLLTSEEVEKHPAGQGRSEPDPLEKPNRPDTSFVWFLNPIKSLKYILWHNYRWLVLKVLFIILLSLLFILFFYSLPGYTVKKMLGA
ncbi:hypothetical protein HELRODRAFT_114638 [Helobdella robusta]|uniref:C2 domain-containing protein n=1 Tax=Helobdella robusta TaxID=6412 RepID=T1EG36_HELRO|nr:hypothetical protein HELRODRAFT_114638 [Helobdella robusta]ESN95703.1 hypothetical protein HELRODRAFT_114638 [Helobdella robusta]